MRLSNCLLLAVAFGLLAACGAPERDPDDSGDGSTDGGTSNTGGNDGGAPNPDARRQASATGGVVFSGTPGGPDSMTVSGFSETATEDLVTLTGIKRISCRPDPRQAPISRPESWTLELRVAHQRSGALSCARDGLASLTVKRELGDFPGCPTGTEVFTTTSSAAACIIDVSQNDPTALKTSFQNVSVGTLTVTGSTTTTFAAPETPGP